MNKQILNRMSVLCLILPAMTTPVAADRCSENENVTARMIESMKTLETKKILTREDARQVAKPFIDAFTEHLDWNNCDGYAKKVRDVAEDVISDRIADLKPLLVQECRQPNPQSHDPSKMSAISEFKEGGRNALTAAGFDAAALCDRS